MRGRAEIFCERDTPGKRLKKLFSESQGEVHVATSTCDGCDADGRSALKRRGGLRKQGGDRRLVAGASEASACCCRR